MAPTLLPLPLRFVLFTHDNLHLANKCHKGNKKIQHVKSQRGALTLGKRYKQLVHRNMD